MHDITFSDPILEFKKESLSTKGLDRKSIDEKYKHYRQKLDSYLSSVLTSTQYQQYTETLLIPEGSSVSGNEDLKNFAIKLRNIQQKLKKGESTEFEGDLNIKYLQDGVKEYFAENFYQQSLHYYREMKTPIIFSCLSSFNPYSTRNSQIDPNIAPNPLDPKFLQNPPEQSIKSSPNLDKIRKEVISKTDIETTFNEEKNKIKFELNLENFNIIFDYDIKNKKVNIIIGSVFPQGHYSEFFPEEIQLLMLQSLAKYCSQEKLLVKSPLYDDLIQFHNISKFPHEINILDVLSSSKIKITQQHIINPKSLRTAGTSLSALADEASLFNRDITQRVANALNKTPNLTNSKNFLLQVNKLLEENGLNKIEVENSPKIVVRGIPDDIYPSQTCLGMNMLFCLYFRQRPKNQEIKIPAHSLNFVTKSSKPSTTTLATSDTKAAAIPVGISNLPKQLSM